MTITQGNRTPPSRYATVRYRSCRIWRALWSSRHAEGGERIVKLCALPRLSAVALRGTATASSQAWRAKKLTLELKFSTVVLPSAPRIRWAGPLRWPFLCANSRFLP